MYRTVEVGGDDRLVVGTELDGRVIAWRRSDGERSWSTDKFLHRDLGTPLLVGNSIAVGDAAGFVHLLSRQDGSVVNRLTTDGSPIASTPAVADTTMVVVTQKGNVFGFLPQ